MCGDESESEVSEDESGEYCSRSDDHGHGGLHCVREGVQLRYVACLVTPSIRYRSLVCKATVGYRTRWIDSLHVRRAAALHSGAGGARKPCVGEVNGIGYWIDVNLNDGRVGASRCAAGKP
ncbi:hypothetical protein GCM10027447_34060 [Glycomyces halotolerans]